MYFKTNNTTTIQSFKPTERAVNIFGHNWPGNLARVGQTSKNPVRLALSV